MLSATLRKLPELSARQRLWGRIDGDGGSIGAIETRPAISDTRWREERLRNRGEEGDRTDGGRAEDGFEPARLADLGEDGRECIGEEISGSVIV